jgi:nicotinamide-nucleotide amidase
VYATDLKHSLADVSQADLDEHGPVHEVVARQLAAGARRRIQADYGLAVTGVAGPSSQGGRAVGEVFVSVATEDGVSCRHCRLPGSRGDIRSAAAAEALSDLLVVLDCDTGTAPE